MSKTAVIYARFSCSKQREASINDQLRICREWCAREGYRIVAEYCDHAMSGTTDERPNFQSMIRHAGESKIVLVYAMDRFSRNIYDAPIYKKKLRDKGVRVLSATETMPDGPEAILIEHIYEAMAAMESERTSRRVKRGMEGNALKCLHNGIKVFGYAHGDDGRYVIDEAEAEIVREIFRRKISGESAYEITQYLHKKGCRLCYNSVAHIIKNEKYIGVYQWGDIRIEDGVPKIVSKEDFYMAQTIRPKKQRASEDWGAFLLSGKALCGECGRGLVGTSGHGKSGTKYEYYKCLNKGCTFKPIRAVLLETSIVDAIRSLLSDRDEALRIARIIEEHATDKSIEKKITQAKKRRSEAENGIDRIMDAIAGGLDATLAQKKIDELQTQMEVADAEIAVQQNAKFFSADDFADFLQTSTAMDDEVILKAFVYQAIVGAEEIIVVLNYHLEDATPKRLKIPVESVRRDLLWCAQRDSNPRP